MREVVVIGPGSIGQAIARRVGTAKHVVLADLREENAASAARTMSEAGFDVSTCPRWTCLRANRCMRWSRISDVAEASVTGPGPRGRRVAVAGVAVDDSQGGSLRHRRWCLKRSAMSSRAVGAGVVIASAVGHRLARR